MKEHIEGVGEVTAPSTPKEKLTNFWYHYKWHSLVSLLLVFVIIICSLQFCKKESYDIYVFYAGSKSIGRTNENGNTAEIATINSSLKKIINDFDDNGEKNLNFSTYYFLSEEEMGKLDASADYSYITNDRNTLSATLQHSEYYLCFISPAVYEEYNKNGELNMFLSLEEYASTYSALEYYAPNAIKLSSTEFYKMPGISGLPEDTLICIKTPGALASKSKEHKEYVNNAFATLENILNYKTD